MPAKVSATVPVPVTLVPLTATLHLTLCSLLVPPLRKLKVKVGIGLDATVLVTPPVASVLVPTETDVSSWPCRPGAGVRRRPDHVAKRS